MATGDFSSIKAALPASLGFVNNQIPVTSLSPVALNILKTLPAISDPTGRALYGLVSNQDEDLITGKVDYQVNAKHSVFGRFTSAKLKQTSTYDGKNPLSINNYGLDDLDYGVAIGHTWVISPSLV